MSRGEIFEGYLLFESIGRSELTESFFGQAIGAEKGEDLVVVRRWPPDPHAPAGFAAALAEGYRRSQRLDHPNLGPVIAGGDWDQGAFAIHRYLTGQTLKAVIGRLRKRDERMPERLLAFAIARLAEALHVAHGALNDGEHPLQRIHGEVTPRAVIVGYDGRPAWIGFGRAHARSLLADPLGALGLERAVYRAPEQVQGQPLDARADVYALGIVLFEMLTGHVPWKATNERDLARQIIAGDVTIPKEVGVSERLRTIVGKALKKDPEDRTASAGELAAELDRFVVDEAQTVEFGSLSAFMRKLFRQEYVAEEERLRELAAAVGAQVQPMGDVPTDPLAASPASIIDLGDGDAAAVAPANFADDDRTVIDTSPRHRLGSAELDRPVGQANAGSDTEPEDEVTGLAELLVHEKTRHVDPTGRSAARPGAAGLQPQAATFDARTVVASGEAAAGGSMALPLERTDPVNAGEARLAATVAADLATLSVPPPSAKARGGRRKIAASEWILLALMFVVGTTIVGGLYSVTRYGLPPALEVLRGPIEALTGPLPPQVPPP